MKHGNPEITECEWMKKIKKFRNRLLRAKKELLLPIIVNVQ